MREHFEWFMKKIIENHHAEIAPTLAENEERWYSSFFGVYHPQKTGQVRVIFDSSAQHHGISLNSVLFKGPDLNNSLLGILLTFRKDRAAVAADICQTFHYF